MNTRPPHPDAIRQQSAWALLATLLAGIFLLSSCSAPTEEHSAPVATHVLVDTLTGETFSFDWDTQRDEAGRWIKSQHSDEVLDSLLEGGEEVRWQRDSLIAQLERGHFDLELAEYFSLKLQAIGNN